jgi:hypothetical protein
MDGSSQFRLIHDDREQIGVLPRSLSSYVPVLQSQSGELSALAHASPEVWDCITPLVVFVAQRRVSGADPRKASTVAGWAKRAAAAVGNHCFYVDVLRADPEEEIAKPNNSRLPLLTGFFEAARRWNLKFIPVLGEAATPGHAQLVSQAVGMDGRGLAVRCPLLGRASIPGTSLPARLTDLVGQVGARPECVDIIFDLGYLDEDVEIDLEALSDQILAVHAAGEWRSMILIGCSIPSMLTEIPEGTVSSIDRREWEVWRHLADSGMERIPAYGDYAVQHPHPPSGGGPGMRRNIRYTSETSTVIARGEGDLLQSDDDQYVELCRWIKDSGAFMGAAYSWGDRVIDHVSRRLKPPGRQAMWRGAGTSHHLQFVTEQLASRQTGE